MVPEWLIVHCSDSSWGTIEDIDQWHKERGFKRSRPRILGHVGYHRVITNGLPKSKGPYALQLDGVVFWGRELDEIGAHVSGMNDNSIGICMIGKDGIFTELQLSALYIELESLMKQFKLTPHNVLGHCETMSGRAQGKTCPAIPMQPIRDELIRRSSHG